MLTVAIVVHVMGMGTGLDAAVLAADAALGDKRYTVQRHTDTVFTMPHYENLADWEAEAAKLRDRILIASGLFPLPERTPLNPRITGTQSGPGYTVENVAIEAYPGFFVTGNLFRPEGDGPFPGVICPHGHWEHGRLEHSDKGSVPARGATLARMGMVAFTYDMVGYQDQQPIGHTWGSQQYLVWGLHPFALQLWSAVRALDYLESLPEVDPERLACTGASGGGTQTFAISAIDPRVKVAAPVNMISSTMQGGCVCENAPLIRLGHSNMEIGALMAPRPLLLVSATGDWTRETPQVEYPAIRSVYELYGAADQVMNVHIDAGHNYNQASREAMYRFFGPRLLPDNDWSNYTEPPFDMPDPTSLRVFPDGPPAEAKDLDALAAYLRETNRVRWQAHLPQTDAERAAFRDGLGKALSLALDAEAQEPGDLEIDRRARHVREGHVLEQFVLKRTANGARIPANFYHQPGAGSGDAVLLVHGGGKAALADEEGNGPGAVIEAALESGLAVLAVDVFGVGEHQRRRGERRQRHAFNDTFLPTETAWRVQDVLTATAFLKSRRDLGGAIHLVGIADGGIWVSLAGALDPSLAKIVADFGDIDFREDAPWLKDFYVPSIQAIGGMDTALALLQPAGTISPGQHVDRPKLTVIRGNAHFGEGAPSWVALSDEDWPAAVRSLAQRMAFYPANAGGQ